MKTFIKVLIICFLWVSIAFADASSITVTTSSTSVVTADMNRTSLLIKNIGSTTCYITDEATATITDFELAPDDVFIANGRQAKIGINGITSSGTTELRVWTGKS